MANKGETAYLTGGANGIGRAVTTMLVSKGIKVFVADADVQGLRNLASEFNTDPHDPKVWTGEVDVAEWESQERAFKTALSHFGRIDYVLPIAGIGERRSFPNKPKSDEFEKPDLKVIEIDEIGVIYTVSLAVQHFRRLEVNKDGYRGRIIVVASICGFYIHTVIPMYTAAKHAVVGFVRSFGKVLLEEHMTFNAICPNKVRTSIGTAASYEKAEKLGVLVPMEKLIGAFEMLLSQGQYKDISGECLEVPPQLPVRIVPKMEWINEESKMSADITYERSHYLHEVVD